jgi:hypothetical protein
VVTRLAVGAIGLIGFSVALMTIPDVRQIGTNPSAWTTWSS